MNTEKFLNGLKSLLLEESSSFEIWVFGSSLNTNYNYNDIDIRVIIHDNYQSSLIKKIKNMKTSLLLEKAPYYSSHKRPQHKYHIVLFNTREFDILTIGNSVKKGKRIFKQAA